MFIEDKVEINKYIEKCIDVLSTEKLDGMMFSEGFYVMNPLDENDEVLVDRTITKEKFIEILRGFLANGQNFARLTISKDDKRQLVIFKRKIIVFEEGII